MYKSDLLFIKLKIYFNPRGSNIYSTVCTPDQLNEPPSCPGYKILGWCAITNNIFIAALMTNCFFTCGRCRGEYSRASSTNWTILSDRQYRVSIYHRLIWKKCFQVIRAVSINVSVGNFCRLSGFFFTVPKVFNEDAISHSFGTEDQNSFMGDPIFFWSSIDGSLLALHDQTFCFGKSVWKSDKPDCNNTLIWNLL